MAANVSATAPFTDREGLLTRWAYSLLRSLALVTTGQVVAETSVANLPTTPLVGQLGNVSDSTTAVWGATVTGGGANRVAVRWNGTDWTVTGS